MSQTLLQKQPVVQKIEVLLRAMHDSRLLPGLVISLVLLTLMAGRPSSLLDLSALQRVVVPIEKSAPAAEEDRQLASSMRAAMDYSARKYHVSAEVLQPLFVAAQDAARENGLDPLLVVAVISIESRFNPIAESVAGAQGLMQVMPQWHQDKLPEGAARTALFDPITNIRVGTQVLGESIRREGGLIAGLQQFAGASDDPELGYANKVIAERQQLAALAGRARQRD